AHWRYLLWVLVVAKCLTPPLVNVPISLLPPQAQVATQAGATRAMTNGPTDVDAADFRFQPPASSDFPQGPSSPKHTAATAAGQAAQPQFPPQLWLVPT